MNHPITAKPIVAIRASIFLALLAFPFGITAQITGGRANSEPTPKAVEPAKLSAGGFAGDVNVFTGAYGATIPLGSVNTPGGLGFNLIMSYSPSFTVGGTPPISKGIPYGEGWNLNLPTISVETQAFNNFDFSDYCFGNSNSSHTHLDFSADGIQPEDEGDLHWFAPYVDIPGVVSGRAIFKYVDAADDKAAVFVLQNFESPVELRFNSGVWTVTLADGTQYLFRTNMHSVNAPVNQRILNYTQAGWEPSGDNPNYDNLSQNAALSTAPLPYGAMSGSVHNVILPKEGYNMWYCDEITHKNMPLQAITFDYDKYGKFNYFQEFKQQSFTQAEVDVFKNTTFPAENDFFSYTDILLKEVYSSSIYNVPVTKIKLNYATDKAIILGNTISMIDFRNTNLPGAGRLDSLYSFVSVYNTNTAEFTGWNKYAHAKQHSPNAPIGDNTNPYYSSQGYRRSLVGAGSTSVTFDHSFLESPRIAPGNGVTDVIVPGDIYEVRAHISNLGNDPRKGRGTVDIAVVTGPNGNFDGTSSLGFGDYDNNGAPGLYPTSGYIQTRGTPIFSTFNMALKWTLSGSATQTSNFFVMPNLPSTFDGFNVQIGPGNSDINYAATYSDVAGDIYGTPDAKRAYAHNQAFAAYPLKFSAAISPNFGVGLPWAMMVPVYKKMVGGDPNDPFRFWWNDDYGQTINQQPNIPTKLDETVQLNDFEVIRYTKNPYMLVSVEQFRYNGEYEAVTESSAKLIAKKEFLYSHHKKPILENYNPDYAAAIQYKQNLFQVEVLLECVRDVPVMPTTDTTQYLSTFLDYKLLSNNPGSYTPGSETEVYAASLLTRFVDQLGGITDITYYPINSPQTNFSDRYTFVHACDATSTGASYGNPDAVTVHPSVHFIYKNDEDDLLILEGNTQTHSALPGHKRWEYIYDTDSRVYLNTLMSIHNNHFHSGYRQAYSTGFRNVRVNGPTLVEGGSSYVNYTTYEHYGYNVSSANNTLEDYLYHGKIKLIRQYDNAGRLFEETTINYGNTLAFKHGYNRPNPYRENFIWQQLYDNSLTGNYEYRDYYRQEVAQAEGPDHTFYYGTEAYSFMTIPMFTGKSGYTEKPKFLEFYHYNEIQGTANLPKDYFMNSYFVKKVSEINRKYDEFQSKAQLAPTGTGTPVNPPPVELSANPFGAGIVNVKANNLVADLLLTVQITTGNPATVTNMLIANSPISDNVLLAVLNSLTLSPQQQMSILAAQNGLSNTVWQAVLTRHQRFDPRSMLTLINNQPYFSDNILNTLTSSLNNTWDDHIVEAIYLRNPRLSNNVLLNLTSPSVNYIASNVLVNILSGQPQLSSQVLSQVIQSPFLSPLQLVPVLANQVLTSVEYQLLISLQLIDNETLISIVERQAAQLDPQVIAALINRVPTLSLDEVTRLLNGLTKDLDQATVDLIDLLYPEIDLSAEIRLRNENPLAASCISPVVETRSYIETRTDYEYYEATWEGIAIGRAYPLLMGIDDIPSRTVTIPNGSYTQQVTRLVLRHEPSWQVFSVTKSSPHLPTAKSEEQFFYLYDLKNRNDRHWYNYDIGSQGGASVAFNPIEGRNDTIGYSYGWDQYFVTLMASEDAVGGDIYNGPKYDGNIYSRERGMRTTPFQKTTITKSQRDERAIMRSEYYFHEARWDSDVMLANTGRLLGNSCEPEDPEEDPTPCHQCLPIKQGTFEEIMEGVPVDYCLWKDDVIGYYYCPDGIHPEACYPGATFVDCNSSVADPEDPAEYIPITSLLSKSLQLKTFTYQIDTITGAPTADFQQHRTDNFNTYIADFYSQDPRIADLDHEGFYNVTRMIYPFDTLTTLKVYDINEHLQPKKTANQAGLYTVYNYTVGQNYFNYYDQDCPDFDPYANYTSVDIRDIGLPQSITVGYGLPDALTTHYKYSDAGLVSEITTPTGVVTAFTFDGFQRLASVTENGRLLSKQDYHYWNHDGFLSFDQRRSQNFVHSSLYDAATTLPSEEQRAYVDPLGRETKTKRTYLPVGATNPVTISSGDIIHDNWSRVRMNFKPFTGPVGNSDKRMVNYENDPGNLAVRASDNGRDISDPHVVRTTTSIVNNVYASCELGLNKDELYQVMNSGNTSQFRFLRTAILDQDDKLTVTYTNAMGQKIATIGHLSALSKVVTLFIYDNYGNLSRTINANRQRTDYQYNILGLLVKETSVDAGTKRYMYNIQGLVSGIQTEEDRVLPTNATGNDVMKFRQLDYDQYGRLLAQRLVSYSYRDDAFCYANSSLGAFGVPITDAAGRTHYFRYQYSNRSSMDWANNYITFDGTTPVVELTRTGLPTGTSLTEKTTIYGLTGHGLGKPIETGSYNNTGVLVQRVQYAYDNEDRVATQIIVQHPENIALNDARLAKATITYPAYNFRGSLIEERIDMGSDNSVDMNYHYVYDPLNRLTQVRAHQGIIVVGSATLLAEYTYDDANGLLLTKKYRADGTPVVQTVTHQYDVRDRLTAMGSALYTEQLYYDNLAPTNVPSGSTVIASHNYNGNINATVSSYSNVIPVLGAGNGHTIYGYRYDGLNRLINADATVSGLANVSGSFMAGDESMSYDRIGNMTSLRRVTLSTLNTPVVEQLSYQYAAGTNRLTRVNATAGTAVRNYTYDRTGNLLTDNSRQITGMEYGRISYPFTITETTKSVSYLYDAGDQRFYRKVTALGAMAKEELYIRDAMGRDVVIKDLVTGQHEYFVFGTERFATIRPDGTLNKTIQKGEVIFSLYDHLGNNRVSFSYVGTGLNQYNISYAGDYFPYGKTLRHYTPSTAADRYVTTMHERDEETGYDYRGARYYDSDVARFLSLDPMANGFPNWSAYNYVLANPVILTDPDGETPKPPVHFDYLTTTALQIIDFAIAQGASSKGAVLVLAHAIRESGWDGSTENYNLFGRMAGKGEPSNGSTAHGKVKDYTELGKYEGSLKEYFSDLAKKYPDALVLIKSTEITADKINQAYRTAGYQLSDEERRKTGKSSWCKGCDGYGDEIVELMGSVRKYMGKSLNYGIKQIDEFLSTYDFYYNGHVLNQDAKDELKMQRHEYIEDKKRYQGYLKILDESK